MLLKVQGSRFKQAQCTHCKWMIDDCAGIAIDSGYDTFPVYIEALAPERG